MAFGVKIRGIPRDDGMPVWQVEAPWWNKMELAEDSRFRIVYSPGYRDYVAVLEKDEVQALSDRYLEDYKSGIQNFPDHWWISHFQRLQKGLAQGPESTRWVLVEIYEWESGL